MELQKLVEGLLARVDELERKLNATKKDSSTSSKPPSSDIVKKKPNGTKTKRGGKRKSGGQKGHVKHVRPAFEADEVDAVWDYTLSQCPECGGELDDAGKAPKVVQQVENIEKPIRIDEHRGLAYWCPSCHKVHYAPLPPEVEKGPASRAAIDDVGRLSEGRLPLFVFDDPAILSRCPENANLARSTGEDDCQSDESDELRCDYFGAYRKYMREMDLRVQFCLAHMIRDMKYLATLPDPLTKAYGERLLDAVRKMFSTLHRSD